MENETWIPISTVSTKAKIPENTVRYWVKRYPSLFPIIREGDRKNAPALIPPDSIGKAKLLHKLDLRGMDDKEILARVNADFPPVVVTQIVDQHGPGNAHLPAVSDASSVVEALVERLREQQQVVLDELRLVREENKQMREELAGLRGDLRAIGGETKTQGDAVGGGLGRLWRVLTKPRGLTS